MRPLTGLKTTAGTAASPSRRVKEQTGFADTTARIITPAQAEQ